MTDEVTASAASGTGLSPYGSRQLAGSPVPASVPDADANAEDAAKLGTRFREIKAGEYACSHIVCKFPHDGNCWCFNTALAQHIAQGMETRQGGDGTAPSRSDDSPVAESDAPKDIQS